MFRGNAKIAERVRARLRTSLGAIVEEPCPSDLNALLRELDARAAIIGKHHDTSASTSG